MEPTATTHAAFIVTAYAAAAIIVCGLIAWIVIDYRIQRRTLGDLKSRGVARRSGRSKDKT